MRTMRHNQRVNAPTRLGRWLRLCLLLLLLPLGQLEARSVELWQTWVARHHVTQVAEAEHSVFVLADGALHAIDKAGGGLRLYDRSSGLSDVGISHIAWASEVSTLIIVYHSGMIDLLTSAGVRSVPALRDATQLQLRQVRQIVSRGARAWLSGDFGIMQLDLTRAIVEGTYLLGEPVEAVALTEGGEGLLAVVSGQISEGRLSDNLQDPSAWRERTELGRGWRRLASLAGAPVGLRGEDLLHLSEVQPTPVEALNTAGDLFQLADGLALERGGLLYTLGGEGLQQIGSARPLAVSGSVARGRIWLALGDGGVSLIKKLAGGWEMTTLEGVADAPRNNNMYAMRYHRGRLYVVGGGRDKDRFHTPGVVQIFDGKRWQSLTARDIEPQTGVPFLDPTDIMPHRDGKPHHVYVSTWGEGLYELDEGRVVARYDVGNSALSSALSGQKHYTRVGSLAYDAAGNLWMAQGLTEASGGGSIVRLSPSGQWRAYDYQPIRASNSFHTHLALPSGTKWLLDNHLSDHGEGVFVYNDRGTDDIADDAYAHYSALRESSGKQINFSKISAMARDKQGALWMGANIGFFYIPRPDDAPRPERLPTAVRPIATASDGSLFYVLDNVPVNAIAIDALNRKWMGTSGSGLYLLSADGLQVLRHYTPKNSPLLSDHIMTLAIDEAGGRLFVGTSMGLNVLDTRTAEPDAATGVDLIAYPNPLRPEHPHLITLEGLTAGAIIEVSDAAGRLVHRGEAVDYRYEWHTYGRDGRALPSGVYTIVAHSRSQSSPAKTKVTIISND